MKIGVLGGTFDPIHLGHMSIADNAVKDLALDKVIFIPAGLSAHKSKQFSSDYDRLRMVELAIEDKKNYFIEDYEIKKKTKSYSYETMKFLLKKYPEQTLYFLIGEDSLLSIETWYRWKDFLSMTNLAVYRRPGSDDSQADIKAKKMESLGYKVKLFQGDSLDISSTKIRQKVYLNEDISSYVSEKVNKYISENKLYRPIIKEDLYEK